MTSASSPAESIPEEDIMTLHTTWNWTMKHGTGQCTAWNRTVHGMEEDSTEVHKEVQVRSKGLTLSFFLSSALSTDTWAVSSL
jgi:hypothetical protein